MQRSPETDSRFDTARRGLRRILRIPVSIALLSAGLVGFTPLAAKAQAQIQAQTPVATATPAPSLTPDAIKQREQELDAARAAQKSAADAQEKLKADIAAIGQDRSKLNQQLIDLADQVRGVESKIGDAEARLRPLDDREQQIRG